MKMKLFLISLLGLSTFYFSCKPGEKAQNNLLSSDTLLTNSAEEGMKLRLEFTGGKSFNHPSLAIWIEGMDGSYLQTLYVSESIAKGVFKHGDAKSGKWLPGEIRRPAALPYWGHKWGVQAPDGLYIPTPQNPLPDAITGATPGKNFMLHTQLKKDLPQKFRVMLEINQTWDWNEFWTNNKYPDDEEYKTSCQPAVVYSFELNPSQGIREGVMKAIGHSHYSGKDGNLYTDISTLTTALQIADRIELKIEE